MVHIKKKSVYGVETPHPRSLLGRRQFEPPTTRYIYIYTAFRPTYIHVYIHIHIYVHVYIYIYIFVCTCTHECLYKCVYVHTYLYIHVHTNVCINECTYISNCLPPNKLLGCGVSTPYTLLCLICTISSELNYSLIFSHLRAGVDIRWFSVDGFDSHWIPRSCSSGLFLWSRALFALGKGVLFPKSPICVGLFFRLHKLLWGGYD